MSAADPSIERRIQAGFLLNFARYVEWPVSAFSGNGAPIAICVLGDDPFGSFLDETIRGENIRGHRVVIRRERAPEVLRDCHVVFMTRVDPATEAKYLEVLSGRPILTVGEAPGFTERGGVVNFYIENERVRFEISRSASERSGLKMHPQLLRLARVVAAKGLPPPPVEVASAPQCAP